VISILRKKPTLAAINLSFIALEIVEFSHGQTYKPDKDDDADCNDADLSFLLNSWLSSAAGWNGVVAVRSENM